jgi:hypothetical protein
MPLGAIYCFFVESSEDGVDGKFLNDTKFHFEWFIASVWMVERIIHGVTVDDPMSDSDNGENFLSRDPNFKILRLYNIGEASPYQEETPLQSTHYGV